MTCLSPDALIKLKGNIHCISTFYELKKVFICPNTIKMLRNKTKHRLYTETEQVHLVHIYSVIVNDNICYQFDRVTNKPS
jgi:hypothetical protein